MKLSLSNSRNLFHIESIRTERQLNVYSWALSPGFRVGLLFSRWLAMRRKCTKTCIVEASNELFNREIVGRIRKPLQDNQNIEKKRWTHGVKKPFVK